MNHWRCGRPEDAHADWCSMPGGCGHCGWRPHRWWCAVVHVYARDMMRKGRHAAQRGAA